jgi:hypothetical protein
MAPAATRTVVKKSYSTLTSTTFLVATRISQTSYTSTISTQTDVSTQLSLATSFASLPDSTNTLLLTNVSTLYTGSVGTIVNYTSTTVLPSPRTTTAWYAVATLNPVPVDYTSIAFPNGIDKLPDYSWAGYHGSNKPLPPAEQPATIFINATDDGSDRTADLQAAIDTCGSGGVIELAAGTYTLNGSLVITNSNCVLRGVRQTSGDPVVILQMLGSPARRRACFLRFKERD